MRCSHCSHENRPAAQFCEQCGRPLRRLCPQCGTPNRAEARFCDHCGHNLTIPTSPQSEPPSRTAIPEDLASRLQTARAQQTMVGERRVVTMLFCDVAGSTAAAEKLDPEEWREIINGAFESMIAPVYRFEGTLARLMGDAILAFFGAPLAHEDDPQRAVLAALEIAESSRAYWQTVEQRWGVTAGVRIGIHTGLVVVGAVGSDHMMEYTAVGDAINLAARLEQTAEPGTIQVSEHTYRLVGPVFEWEPLGEIELKGKGEPVRTYRPIGKKSTPGRLRGLAWADAPLIGRDRELDRFAGILKDLRAGRGGILVVSGEAGLGKSRLIREARHRWEQLVAFEARAPAWIERRPSSYEASHAYSLLVGILRAIAGLNETAARLPVLEALEAAIRNGNLEADEVDELVIVVGRLLEALSEADPFAATDTPGFQPRLARAVERLLELRFGEAPGVLVIDDLHWADAATVELLGDLIQLVERIPLLLVFASRPEWDTPGWHFIANAENRFPHRTTKLQLRPLEAEEGLNLAAGLLSTAALPDDFAALVRTRAEGNPFFVEELIREAVENGTLAKGDAGWQTVTGNQAWEVPDNVEALLSARIDRLGPEARLVLQTAAVIGRVFQVRVLESLVDPVVAVDRALEELERGRMVEEVAREPEREYSFRHALTQETAYRSILKSQRKQMHRQAGGALEKLYKDRSAELAPVLAHHFEEAGENGRAMHFHALAGDAASRLYAVVEAVQHYDRALQLGQMSHRGTEAVVDEDLKRIFLRKGRALELGSRFNDAYRNYEAMEAWGADHGDDPMVLDAVLAQAVLRCTPTVLYDAERGRPLADRALELARRIGDAEAEARALWARMNLFRFDARQYDAIEIGREGLAIAEAGQLAEITGYLHHDLGYVFSETGDYDEASASFSRAAEIWEELGNLPMLADGLIGDIINLTARAQFDRALDNAAQGLAISERIHNPWGLSFSRMYLGTIYRELGMYGKGIAAAQKSLEEGRAAGFLVPDSICGYQLTIMYLDLGELTRAEALAQKEFDRKAWLGRLSWSPIGALAMMHVLIAKGELESAAEIGKTLFVDDPERGYGLVWLFDGNISLRLDLELGSLDRALQAIDERLESTKRLNFAQIRPDLMLLKGRGLQAKGELELAGTTLADAARTAMRQQQRRVAVEIQAARVRLALDQGDPEAAEALRQEGREIVDFIRSHVPESFLAGFDRRPDVRILT